MRRLLILPGLIVAGLMVAGAPARAQVVAPNRCIATVESEIDRVGLDRTRIRAIQIARQTRQIGDNMRTVGFDGWVRLNDCPGSMVVDMDLRCGVRQTYVRGMCGVEGVKTFD